MEKISIARRRLEKDGRGDPEERPPFPFGRPQEIPASCPPVPLPLSLETLMEQLRVTQAGENRFAVEIVQDSRPVLHLLARISAVGAVPPPWRDYRTPEEAARLLRVSRGVIYRELRRGTLKGIRVGRQWRVLLEPSLETTTRWRA